MNHFYGSIADVIAAFHLAYVVFAVGGEVYILAGAALRRKAARNFVFRVVHVSSVVLVAMEAITGAECPLTLWEYRFRHLAGQGVEEHLSFIARLAGALVFYDFPAWVFTIVHISFGCLVVLTYVLIPPDPPHRNRR
jgi:hypothetical protein